jgi:hypothetical protein
MIKNHVIVGLDDSAASRAAHRWAAAYAQTTGKHLRAVHVLDWPIGLCASAFKSGIRLLVPKQEIAEPYRRGIQGVFDDTNSASGSVLQFAQGDVGDILVRLGRRARCGDPRTSPRAPLFSRIGQPLLHQPRQLSCRYRSRSMA